MPCVATDVGDMGHFVKQDGTGLVSDAGSTQDFAAKTVQLLTEHETRAEIERNLDAVIDQYSWENIASGTVEVYIEVLD